MKTTINKGGSKAEQSSQDRHHGGLTSAHVSRHLGMLQTIAKAHKITIEELRSITIEWEATNERRCSLIFRKHNGGITGKEHTELERLQYLTDVRMNLFGVQPMIDIDKLPDPLRSQAWIQQIERHVSDHTEEAFGSPAEAVCSLLDGYRAEIERLRQLLQAQAAA